MVTHRVNQRPSIAILGAGIMGCSIALFLARKNMKIVLIDAANNPFMHASRWNEGKIHLGYLYAADQTLNTARKLIPGGLAFPNLIRDLIGVNDFKDLITPHNDTYLIHRDSLIDPESAFTMAKRVSDLTLEHADRNNYFVSLFDNKPTRLTQSELNNHYNTEEILAGYRVAERSISTNRLGDHYLEALNANSNIEFIKDRKVLSIQMKNSAKEHWNVHSIDLNGMTETLGPFDAVINALWEGRGAIDASVGIKHSDSWTHRYRVSLFARTSRPVNIRSAVIALGPFGDVKNYDGNNLYLSWYDAGLLTVSNQCNPPPAPILNSHEQSTIAKLKLKMLGQLIPDIQSLASNIESYEIKGGWVYAAGQGLLNDPQSGLHRRDNIGFIHQKGYFSIDTGKYSIAPWLSQQVAKAVGDKVGCL